MAGDEVRRGADEYAVSVLVSLEGEVVRTLQSIKKGIELLDERRADLREQAASEDGFDAEAYDEVQPFDPTDEEEGASQPARL